MKKPPTAQAVVPLFLMVLLPSGEAKSLGNPSFARGYMNTPPTIGYELTTPVMDFGNPPPMDQWQVPRGANYGPAGPPQPSLPPVGSEKYDEKEHVENDIGSHEDYVEAKADLPVSSLGDSKSAGEGEDLRMPPSTTQVLYIKVGQMVLTQWCYYLRYYQPQLFPIYCSASG